jgi:cyclic pyranopterin phosphate synthase
MIWTMLGSLALHHANCGLCRRCNVHKLSSRTVLMRLSPEGTSEMTAFVSSSPASLSRPMTDPFGRTISYLRVSVTDRCDLRCFYCMSEDMTFLPKADLLTLEELDRLCSAFIAKGVRKLRLTGGEPLVRRNVMSLVRSLSRHLGSGALNELTLTTNGSQLARFAGELRDCGVRRINVSLDTLDPAKFRAITRWGDLDKVLAGVEAARSAGLAVKINAVALKGLNEEEIPSLMEWAHGKGMALTLIEVMPMGDVGEGRIDQYVPLSLLRARLAKQYTLTDLDETTGGPARYVHVNETGGKLGLITPMTHNFCESCNRVRITCTGTLHTCLGHEDASDLRKPLRASAGNELLSAAIDRAIGLKPKGHDFIIDRRHNRPSVNRHMSVTGG